MNDIKLLQGVLVISLSLMTVASLEDVAKADSVKDGRSSDKTESLKQENNSNKDKEKDDNKGKDKDKKKDVPEPLTIVGSGLALGFGVLFKKEYAKKQSQAKV